jgi:transglutaminase/protease-like cytokinesis protein 3
MAFLKFIKNHDGQRPAAEQQSQQQKPEISREASSAVQEQPSKTVSQMPEDIRARARDIGSRIEQSGQNIEQSASALPQAPTEATGNQQPLRQNMTAQDKPAPDLSPTSFQAGIPAKDVEAPARPEATPETSQEQARTTIARRPPSWER